MPARAPGRTPRAHRVPRAHPECAGNALMASKVNGLLVFGHAALRCDHRPEPVWHRILMIEISDIVLVNVPPLFFFKRALKATVVFGSFLATASEK